MCGEGDSYLLTIFGRSNAKRVGQATALYKTRIARGEPDISPAVGYKVAF